MVAAYRDGVPGASDRLWRTSLRLVPRILALPLHRDVTLRQGLASVGREDLDQHVALEILEAAQRFKPEKGSWTTYLSHRLYGRLRDLARRQLRWNAAASLTSSLDEVIEDGEGEVTWHDIVSAPGLSPEEAASRKEALEHYHRREPTRSKRA